MTPILIRLLSLFFALCCSVVFPSLLPGAEFASILEQERPWVRPKALSQGDTIAFVAPSGPVRRDKVDAARTRLELMGFKVLVRDDIADRDRYLAGNDDRRAQELMDAFANPEVDAIFPLRGGYGLTRILERLDYGEIRANPKLVVGFSDTTALHLALSRHARLISFHSPAPVEFLTDSSKEAEYQTQSFWRAILGLDYQNASGAGYVITPHPDAPKPKTLVPGRARGRLTGGNLTMISVTMGTPFEIEADGKILLIEDVHEEGYRLDRYLSQLRLAGVLDKVAGVVAGQFTDSGPDNASAIVEEYLSDLKVPVVVNYPIGHMGWNTTVPLGAMVELDADTGVLQVLEDPVELP